MPNIISGQRPSAHETASSAVLGARRVVDMHSDIMLYDPEAAPLSLLAAAVNKESVGNPKFDVLEDELIPHLDRVSGAFTAGDTAIDVDNGAYFPVNSMIKFQRTGEVGLVTAVTSNTLTVTRSYGGTAAAALVDDDQIVSLGGAAQEGAASETAKSTQVVNGYNYTQIFRWPFDITGTLMASNLYGGPDMPYQQKKAGIEYAKRLDLSGFFGERSSAEAPSGAARRTSGGLLEFISTNSEDLGGGFSLQTFMELANTFFRHGSKSKVMFASRGLVTNIAIEAIQFIQTERSDDTLGLEINSLKTPHGMLKIISHDLLEGDEYGGYGFIVDLDHFGMRFLKGRDTKLNTNIQAPDVDGRKDEFLGEIGWWRSLEKTHGLLSNGA